MFVVLFCKYCMKDHSTEIWFKWFYKNWEKFSPGELIENGLMPSQIAERFVNDNQDNLILLANKFDDKNEDALEEFMKLSESELHIIKYFLKLIQLRKIK